MSRLLLGFCLMFFVFFNTNYVNAKKISIAVIAYETNFSLPSASKLHLQNQISSLFNNTEYTIIKNDALLKDWQNKLSGHFSADPKKLDKIQRQALFELSKKYGYNYILVLSYTLDQSLRNENFLNSKKSVQITLDTKLFQSTSGRYLYNNTITRKGDSKIKSLKDFPEMTGVIVIASNHCTDQLFSALELPLVKKNLN